MIIFPFPQYKHLVKTLHHLPVSKGGKFEVGHFPNQEIYIKINTDVEIKDCLLTGTISPPEENLISFLLLAHTLKKEGASKITALLPYLAYTRQDKIKTGESLAALAIGEIFRASHINEVVTIDIHSPISESLFPLPLYNLSSAEIFAREINKLKIKNPSLVAPDEGAIERCQKVAQLINKNGKIAYVKKKRLSKGVHSDLYGHINSNAIVIDDILDTGATLLSCCKLLKASGAKNIYIFVTHGLFTGDKWRELFSLNVKRIYCTDSIPEVRNLQLENLTVLSISPILRKYVNHIRKNYREFKKITRKIGRERNEDYLLTDF